MRRVNFMPLTFSPNQYCNSQDGVGFAIVTNTPPISVAIHSRSLFLTNIHGALWGLRGTLPIVLTQASWLLETLVHPMFPELEEQKEESWRLMHSLLELPTGGDTWHFLSHSRVSIKSCILTWFQSGWKTIILSETRGTAGICIYKLYLSSLLDQCGKCSP